MSDICGSVQQIWNKTRPYTKIIFFKVMAISVLMYGTKTWAMVGRKAAHANSWNIFKVHEWFSLRSIMKI